MQGKPENNSGRIRRVRFAKGQSGNPNGRPKGRPNKVTLERAHQIAASGVTPLAYMLSVLRDPSSDDADRKWAAEHAAPFCHPRLSHIDAASVVQVTDTRPRVLNPRLLTAEQRDALRGLLQAAKEQGLIEPADE